MKVVTIEDDGRYRSSLETLIGHADGFSLAGSFASAEAAFRHLHERPRTADPPDWDLVLMDLELPGMSGVEATRELKASLPEISVVALTVFEDPNTVLQAICAGADGYVLKRSSAPRLLDHFEAATEGGAPLTPGVARAVLEFVRRSDGSSGAPGWETGDGRDGGRGNASAGGPDGGSGTGAEARAAREKGPTRLDLTDREQEVLRCLVEGLTYKGVGEELGISLDTVRTHVRRIYRKLQVHSVAEAVSRAIREGLI